jgi:photosystem II stability/assembly factor-like uncharacterized protein
LWVFDLDDFFGISIDYLLMEPPSYPTKALHFNNGEWGGVGVDTPPTGDEYGKPDYEDMAGTEDGHLYVVGVRNSDAVFAVVSDGIDWWTEEIPEQNLHAVWALDGENVWAVGDGGAVLRRGDAGWEYEDAPNSARLDGIFGWSAEEQITVGDDVILSKNGTAWELQDVPVDGAQLHGVWGATPDDVYAVGELDGGALIIHFDGTAWSVVYGG